MGSIFDWNLKTSFSVDMCKFHMNFSLPLTIIRVGAALKLQCSDY